MEFLISNLGRWTDYDISLHFIYLFILINFFFLREQPNPLDDIIQGGKASLYQARFPV